MSEQENLEKKEVVGNEIAIIENGQDKNTLENSESRADTVIEVVEERSNKQENDIKQKLHKIIVKTKNLKIGLGPRLGWDFKGESEFITKRKRYEGETPNSLARSESKSIAGKSEAIEVEEEKENQDKVEKPKKTKTLVQTKAKWERVTIETETIQQVEDVEETDNKEAVDKIIKSDSKLSKYKPTGLNHGIVNVKPAENEANTSMNSDLNHEKHKILLDILQKKTQNTKEMLEKMDAEKKLGEEKLGKILDGAKKEKVSKKLSEKIKDDPLGMKSKPEIKKEENKDKMFRLNDEAIFKKKRSRICIFTKLELIIICASLAVVYIVLAIALSVVYTRPKN